MPMMKVSMITWVMIILLVAILGYSAFNMVSEGFKEGQTGSPCRTDEDNEVEDGTTDANGVCVADATA